MPIQDEKFKRLTPENVERAPTRPGVYALYEDKTLIYLGQASGRVGSIRASLGAHLATPPKGATRYKRETSAAPEARLKALLDEFVAEHGRLPRANSTRS